jgi:hypothetical protein
MSASSPQPQLQPRAISRPVSQKRRLLSGSRRPGPVGVLLGSSIVLILSGIYHFLIYVPHPDLPHRLTILDDVFVLGVAGIVGVTGTAIGKRLLRAFPLSDFSRLERAALALGLGWGVLSLAVLLLGLAQLLYLPALLALLGLGLALCWREAWQIISALGAPASYQSLAPLLPRRRLTLALAGIVALELLLLGSQMFTLPYNAPFGYDLYQYHWAVPKLYLLHHGIYGLPGWANADFPFLTEMLNIAALAVNAPLAALWMQAIYGLLAVLLLAGFLARRFGALAAWLGTALCLSSPIFTGVLGSGYAEPGAIYYGVASAALVLAWHAHQQTSRARWRLLLLAGLFAGFGLGARYQEGAVIAGIVLLLLALDLSRLVRAGAQRESLWAAARRAGADLLIYGSAVALPLVPWLVKDAIELSNPIYPAFWNGPAWDNARSEVWLVTMGHYGPQGPLWWRLAAAFFGLFFDSVRGGEPPFVPPNYLLLTALLVPLALLLAWLRRREQGTVPEWLREVAPWLIVACGAYLAWGLSGALLERYAVLWLVLLAVPAAVVLARLSRMRWALPGTQGEARLLRTGVLTLVLLLLIMGPLETFLFWAPASPIPLVTGQVSLRQWEEEHIMEPSYWAMVDEVNTTIPRSAKLLLLGRGAGYFFEGRDYVADSGEDWIPYLETEGKSDCGILRLLHQNGFSVVVYEEQTLEFVIHTFGNTYLAGFLPAWRAFLARALIPIWSYQNFHLYQIPPPDAACQG